MLEGQKHVFIIRWSRVLILRHDTMAKTKIIYPKNVGASVAMNFT